MNIQRRKTINEISSQLGNLEIDWDALHDIKAKIESVRDEEEEYFDNMPENLQQSERGEASEQAKDELAEAIDNLDQLIDAIPLIDEVMNNLDNASEV